MSENKANKKTRIGVVTSDKMEKSVVVLTERLIPHKFYGKYIRRQVKYMADDPQNLCKIGDKVLIEECRPLSKSKRWRLRSILEQAV